MATVHYAHEKFASAVSVLVTHPGSIQSRIYPACQEAARAPLEVLTGRAHEIFAQMHKSWLSNGIDQHLDSLTEVEAIAEARKLLELEYLTRSPKRA